MGFLSSLFNKVDVSVDNNGIVTISGVKFTDFHYFIKKYYKSEAFLDRFIINKKFLNTTIRLYQFYLPELVFLLEKAKELKFLYPNYVDNIIKMIYEKTWMNSTQKSVESIINMDILKKEMKSEFKPMAHQIEFVKDIYYQKKTQYRLNGYLLSLEMGGAKACENGTPVRVPGGWKNIEDLVVGDLVIAVDGTPSKVLGVYPQGVKSMYRVTFDDGRNIKVSGDHLWEIVYPDKKYLGLSENGNPTYEYFENRKVLDTEDLMHRIENYHRKMRTHIPLCECEKCPDADLPIDPYLLGALIGDGSICHNSVSMTTDIDIINRIISRASDSFRTTIKKEDNEAEYSYFCRILRDEDGVHRVKHALEDFGLIGTHAWDKFIPEIYMNGSREQRLELLRGLLDTDGYVNDPKTKSGRTGKSAKCGTIIFSTTSEKLAYQVQLLVRSLGGKCSLRPKYPLYTYNGEIRAGRLSFSLVVKMKIPNEVFTLERKRCRLTESNQYTKYWKLGVEKVERLSMHHAAECTCIAIDHPSKLFVTKDYIVTHNTATSIMLGLALQKKHFVVLAPLSTVHNVWVNEFKKWTHITDIWTIKEPVSNITEDTRVIVANYEAIDKITDPIITKFNANETIIIVDECHNFKDYKALRFKQLHHLNNTFKCKDLLLMSGTPIKALGVECIPIFKLLDPYFTKEVEDTLIKINRYINIMNDLLKNRLGMLMYRKLKSELMQLPPKIEEDLKVTIPDGNKYTIEHVKRLVANYREERLAYYKQNYNKFYIEYTQCLGVFESTLRTSEEKSKFEAYKRDVETLQKFGHSFEMVDVMMRTNVYEKEVIIPKLPSNLRATFRNSKSVIKYVDLKVLGEVLGNMLGKLRIEMTSKMIDQPKVFEIVENAQKKTIMFSSYTDSIEVAASICKKYKFTPITITGDNTKEAVAIVDKFKRDPKINPLIASIKVMSTGHTINEANTVIFLNVPFRSVDYEQAYSRCYRVGQNVPVYVYKLVLDTGNLPNLSTRMMDIISWSKDSFNAIVGDNIPSDIAKEGISITSNDNYIKLFNEIQDIDDPKIQLYLDAIDNKLKQFK